MGNNIPGAAIIVGEWQKVDNDVQVLVREVDANGKILECEGATLPTDGKAGYRPGCRFRKTTGAIGGTLYVNEGSAASCDFNPVLTDIPSEALTATDAGLTTGAMSGNAKHAIVTSSAATKQVSLPASSAALIGKQFTIWVGANGFELITPASSGATINGTDGDGTNQADIPANSLSRLTLVDTDTWLLENIGSDGAVAAAIVPDND